MRIVRGVGDDAEVREGLRVACGTALPVVLVGKGRTLGKGIAQVEVDLARLLAGDGERGARGQRDMGDVLAEIAEALGVEDELDAWRFGTREKPLVILVERGEAWFGKVRLRITANQFAMLLALARTPGVWVGAAALGERISPHASIVDQIARKARVGFDEKVARSFEEAGVAMPDGLPERLIEVDKAKGCYRLGVGVVVR
jgi:hypothetical protein